MNDFFPIILGSDENAYGNARLIKEKYGIKPLLLCKRILIPTRHSRIVEYKTIENFDKESVFPDALLSVLTEYKKKYSRIVVIPCSDYYSMLMSKYYDCFEGLISNKFIPYSLFRTLDTKDKFYELCDKYSLPYPKTVIISYENRENILPFPFEYPVVLKPENSNATEYLSCDFEKKKKVYYLYSDKDYLEIARALTEAGYKGKLIAQEFIEGGDDAMRVVNSYSSNDGRVRISCMGQPLIEEYSPHMLGNYAAIISRGEEPIYNDVTRFLEAVGYTGFSNFDIKYDSKRGKYYFFEINPRPGRSSFFVRAAGFNLMEAMINDAVYERDLPPEYSYNTALWSNVPMGIIKKYVKNKALKKEALSMKRTCLFTLINREEKSIKRMYRVARYYISQYRSFKKYYFEK